MIQKIIINNFQSHEKTEIDLHKNVNSIIGNSNQGKTAILRALLWLITNRPVGISFISHGADNCSVKIVTDSGSVERRRTKDFNGYIINGQKLSAIKTDVPDEIKKVIKVDDVNIQKQLDSPFLLSSSSGEVARFFNKTIKLDLIDKVLSITEKKKRKTKFELKSNEEMLEEVEAELSELDWIDEAEHFVNRLKNIENKIESKEIEYDDLCDNIDIYNENDKIKNNKDIPKIKKLFDQIDEIENQVYDKTNEFDNLYQSICDYDKEQHQIEYCKDVLKELKKKFPKICPLCKGKL
jgi:predicted ATP-dependent endonuclease of OLD family